MYFGHTTLLATFSVLLLVAPVVNEVHGEGDGRIETLLEVREQYIQNRDLLKTWQGMMRLTENLEEVAANHESEYRFDVLFHVDVENQLYASEATCTLSHDVRDGTTRDGFYDGARIGELRLQGSYVNLGPILPGTSQTSSATINPGLASDLGWSSYTQHPLSYNRILNDPIDVRMSAAVDVWKKDWCLSSVRRDESIVTLVQRSSTVANAVNTSVLDLSRGGNLISFQSRDPIVEGDRTISYARINSVWVPDSLTFTHWDREAKRRRKRQIEWITQKVNEPLPADIFSLDGIHTPPGTMISDRGANKLYEFRASESPRRRTEANPPVLPPEPVAVPVPVPVPVPVESSNAIEPQRSGVRLMIIVLNGLVLLMILGYYSVRLFKRNH
jgi:hypothetical protein